MGVKMKSFTFAARLVYSAGLFPGRL
jgi:hypothetical protein